MQQIDIDEFRAQLIEEQQKRFQEIISLKKFYEAIDAEQEDVRVILKSLFVMLHAHLEGFFKTAIDFYITTINQIKITCGESSSWIATATLNPLFVDLERGERKDPLFKKVEFPIDKVIHKHYRRKQIVDSFEEIQERIVNINQDFYVGPKVSFKAKMAKTTLYMLGFRPDLIQEDIIKKLSRIRNEIAHGVNKGVPSIDEFIGMEEEIKELTDDLIEEIVNSLKKQTYLHHVTNSNR